jgi:hypothetical protein
MRSLLPLIVLMGGCASVGDLDQQPPQISYESAKSPAQLEECIGIALASAGAPSTIQGEGRRIMVWEEAGVTMWTVTIYETTPATVEMRWNGPLNSKWRNGVRNCA